ncbi:MAG: hypothetical protein CL836_05945 [Crocinitomicaceae bacterium]|jgi:hypothetical protein|nr:hypothetical protein [Crocinitomicaceae bacterium]MEC9159876.1 hypothetical protein [Bacteroidota bacterium]|tara:strand:+ start:84 stop:305 length:222 start_codon:yes stop_codon:yes gene_type:complete
MKKLLLAFSLIAIFGLGITAASFTLPENTSTVELNDGDGDKKKKKKKKKKSDACCAKGDNAKKSCCKKPSANS